MVYIRPTLPGDVWLVLTTLREAEVREFAALGFTSEECVRLGLVSGECFTAFIHDEAAAIFGVVNMGDHQIPWAVMTTVIDKYPLPFLRAAYRWSQTLTGTLINYVDVRNEKAMKWFKWLGFTLSDPIPYGNNGELFRQVRVG